MDWPPAAPKSGLNCRIRGRAGTGTAGRLRRGAKPPAPLTRTPRVRRLAQALGVALLWVVFVALDYRIAPGPLVAGYAVGNLFMAISITPSGVGVVESAMTLTLAAFGVPLEIAAAGTILFRLFTFWVPMVAGFFTWRTVR